MTDAEKIDRLCDAWIYESPGFEGHYEAWFPRRYCGEPTVYPDRQMFPTRELARAAIREAAGIGDGEISDERIQRAAKHLRREAALYQTANGEPGPLATTWGWREIAKSILKAISILEDESAKFGPENDAALEELARLTQEYSEDEP